MQVYTIYLRTCSCRCPKSAPKPESRSLRVLDLRSPFATLREALLQSVYCDCLAGPVTLYCCLSCRSMLPEVAVQCSALHSGYCKRWRLYIALLLVCLIMVIPWSSRLLLCCNVLCCAEVFGQLPSNVRPHSCLSSSDTVRTNELSLKAALLAAVPVHRL